MIYSFFTSKGYKMSLDDLRQGDGHASMSIRASRTTSGPTCSITPRCCCKEKKISKIPDWKTALRPDFMDKAKAGVLTSRHMTQ